MHSTMTDLHDDLTGRYIRYRAGLLDYTVRVVHDRGKYVDVVHQHMQGKTMPVKRAHVVAVLTWPRETTMTTDDKTPPEWAVSEAKRTIIDGDHMDVVPLARVLVEAYDLGLREERERAAEVCRDAAANAKSMEAVHDRSREPGQHIADVGCPSCGAALRVEHGDDPGEIATISTGRADICRQVVRIERGWQPIHCGVPAAATVGHMWQHRRCATHAAMSERRGNAVMWDPTTPDERLGRERVASDVDAIAAHARGVHEERKRANTYEAALSRIRVYLRDGDTNLAAAVVEDVLCGLVLVESGDVREGHRDG